MNCHHHITVLLFLSFYSVDREKNRLALSLLEEDTGVPENVSKKFQKHLRLSDAPGEPQNASAVTTSKRSVKRKASERSADDSDAETSNKRAKVEGVKASSKKVKKV